MTKVFHAVSEQLALLRFQLQLGGAEPFEYSAEIINHRVEICTEGHNVIQVDKTLCPFQVSEEPIHEALESGRRVTEPKWHYSKFEQAQVCLERSLFHVGLSHRYLPVPTREIECTEPLAAI
jgi:hypothetical protein